MNAIETIEKNGIKIIISHNADILESEKILKSLRTENDHTPFIVIANRGEIIPQVILSNCCGGHLFRDELEKLPKMIEAMSERDHDIHCI
jgi:hypothetical protein